MVDEDGAVTGAAVNVGDEPAELSGTLVYDVPQVMAVPGVKPVEFTIPVELVKPAQASIF